MKALLTNAPECTLKVNRMFSFEWIPLHFDFFYLMLRRLWTSYLSTWKLVRSFWQKQLTVKFRLSEKHTKFEKKILMVLTNQLIYFVNVKTMRKIFSKSPNFTVPKNMWYRSTLYLVSLILIIIFHLLLHSVMGCH